MTSDELDFLGVPPARVDLLRAIPGVDFDVAWPKRTTIAWQGTKVHVVGFDELCEAKRSAGRARDLEDLRTLERFRR